MAHFKVKKMWLLLAILSVCTSVLSQEGVLFSISEDEENSMGVTFKIGNFALKKHTDGAVSIEVKGMAVNGRNVGMPALPSISRLIIMNKGVSLHLHNISIHRDTIPCDSLVSVEPNLFKNGVDDDKDIDNSIYGNAYYSNGEEITLEKVGDMGDKSVWKISINPFAWSRKEGLLRVCSSISADISYEEVSVYSNEYSINNTDRDIFLIVAAEQYRSTLQNFITWKEQQGYRVVVEYVNTSSRDSIFSIIHNYFESHRFNEPIPQFILLVGDIYEIESFIGQVLPAGLDMHYTDLYYAEHSGDMLPDAMLGRWPVHDSVELAAVIEKTIAYEQQIVMDTNSLLRTMYVAGKEDRDPAPITTNGQVNYLLRLTKEYDSTIDTIAYHNPQSMTQLEDIVLGIEKGVAIVGYSAHCTEYGWSLPAFRTYLLPNMQSHTPTIYINNCCLSNRFDVEGLGCSLLKKSDGGAVAVVGATNSTLWDEDYYWAVGAKNPFSYMPQYDSQHLGGYDYLYAKGGTRRVVTLGEVAHAGLLAVEEYGSAYSNYYDEIYCLLGDPSVMPFIGVPHNIDSMVVGLLHIGDMSVGVQTESRAMVSVMQDSVVIGVAVTDSLGMADIELSRGLDSGNVVITATDQLPLYLSSTRSYRLKPRFDTFFVANPPLCNTTIKSVSVSDDSVFVVIKNVGDSDVRNIKVGIYQDSSCIINGSTVGADSVIIGTISAHNKVSIALPYHLLSLGRHPYWEAMLIVSDSACSISKTISHSFAWQSPTIALSLTDNEGDTIKEIPYDTPLYLCHTTNGLSDSHNVSITFIPNMQGVTSEDSCIFFMIDSTITHILVQTYIQKDRYIQQENFYLNTAKMVETFEHSFENLPWNRTAMRTWVVDSSSSHGGCYSVCSQKIRGSQVADLSLMVDVWEDDSVSFYAMTSTERKYDRMVFTIDREEMGEQSGIMTWRRHSYPISKGKHLLRWRYEKDDSKDEGDDRVWIDDISIPLSKWDTTYIIGEACADSLSAINEITPDSNNINSLSLYPNPADREVFVGCTRPCKAALTNIYGQQIYNDIMLQKGDNKVDVSRLANGVYLITIQNIDFNNDIHGTMHTMKIVVNHH